MSTKPLLPWTSVLLQKFHKKHFAFSICDKTQIWQHRRHSRHASVKQAHLQYLPTIRAEIFTSKVVARQSDACCKVEVTLFSKYSCSAWAFLAESLRRSMRSFAGGAGRKSGPSFCQRCKVRQSTFKLAAMSFIDSCFLAFTSKKASLRSADRRKRRITVQACGVHRQGARFKAKQLRLMRTRLTDESKAHGVAEGSRV